MTDYTMMWLAIMIVLIGIEIVTVGLTTIWFAGGATAAFLSTFFGAGPVIQWMLFLVLSLAFLLLTRPMAVRYMKNNQVSTNADSLVGKTVVVSEKIDNLAQSGKVYRLRRHKYYHAHNVFLEILMEGGFCALLCFFMMLASAVKQLMIYRKHPYACLIAAGLMACGVPKAKPSSPFWTRADS